VPDLSGPSGVPQLMFPSENTIKPGPVVELLVFSLPSLLYARRLRHRGHSATQARAAVGWRTGDPRPYVLAVAVVIVLLPLTYVALRVIPSGSVANSAHLHVNCAGRCPQPDPPEVTGVAVARYAIGMGECAQCGARLPRPLPGAGRLLVYCSSACKQKAYRARGGRTSGTTGAQRRRAARHRGDGAGPTPGASDTDRDTSAGAGAPA